jgi:hypothetical protein
MNHGIPLSVFSSHLHDHNPDEVISRSISTDEPHLDQWQKHPITQPIPDEDFPGWITNDTAITWGLSSGPMCLESCAITCRLRGKRLQRLVLPVPRAIWATACSVILILSHRDDPQNVLRNDAADD